MMTQLTIVYTILPSRTMGHSDHWINWFSRRLEQAINDRFAEPNLTIAVTIRRTVDPDPRSKENLTSATISNGQPTPTWFNRKDIAETVDRIAAKMFVDSGEDAQELTEEDEEILDRVWARHGGAG